MDKAIIVVGSGALNSLEENELYKRLEHPIYVLLSHKSDVLEGKAQKMLKYGGQVLFIVDLEQPLKKLSKRQNEQLVELYEQELTDIAQQHAEFLVVGGAGGFFSGAVLQFLVKLLQQKRKQVQVVTWLATPFEGKKYDQQIEEALQVMSRLRMDVIVVKPKLNEQQVLPYLAALNQEIAQKIVERC